LISGHEAEPTNENGDPACFFSVAGDGTTFPDFDATSHLIALSVGGTLVAELLLGVT
jgi:hypothetical protein